MSFHALFIGALLISGSLAPAHAVAGQSLGLVIANAQAAPLAAQTRYELGAVVDVRRASSNGVTILAITPGGAADRLGLQVGDQLRAVNGHRLDDTPKPSSTLEDSLQEGKGALRVEAVRNGRTLTLSGSADTDRSASAGSRSCGYVSALEGVVPRSRGIFQADITQIDGHSTPIQRTLRHRVGSGKHVLVVRELIDPIRLNSAHRRQIAKMKTFAMSRSYKSLVVDVEPGTSYRIGARLLKDKLDAQSIRDNAYWEPVVWAQVPESCR